MLEEALKVEPDFKNNWILIVAMSHDAILKKWGTINTFWPKSKCTSLKQKHEKARNKFMCSLCSDFTIDKQINGYKFCKGKSHNQVKVANIVLGWVQNSSGLLFG